MPIFKPDFSTIISTGSLNLDFALGRGGLPGGSLVKVSGHCSSGKTSLCLSIMAEANKKGHYCAFVDADQGLSSAQIAPFKVDPSLVFLTHTYHTEIVFDIIEHLVRSQIFKIIILDSINSLLPTSDFYSLEEAELSTHFDRHFSNASRKLIPLLHQSGTILIFTHRADEHPKTIYHNLSKNPSKLASKLFTNISIQLTTINYIKENNLICGWGVQAKVLKNRFSPCPRTTKLDIMYNDGIIRIGEVLSLGQQFGLIQKTPSAVAYQGQVLGANIEESHEFLRSSPTTCQKIENEIRRIAFSSKSETV